LHELHSRLLGSLPLTFEYDSKPSSIFSIKHSVDHRPKPIKDYFGLGHIGSVSYFTSRVRREIKLDCELKREIEAVTTYIINNATRPVIYIKNLPFGGFFYVWKLGFGIKPLLTAWLLLAILLTR